MRGDPDFVECSERESRLHFRPIYSEDRMMIVSFHSYKPLVNHFGVELTFSASPCRGIVVNACSMYQNRRAVSYNKKHLKDLAAMRKYKLGNDTCHVFQVHYSTVAGLNDTWSCGTITSIDEHLPPTQKLGQLEFLYSVTAFFTTYLSGLNRQSEAHLQTSKCSDVLFKGNRLLQTSGQFFTS